MLIRLGLLSLLAAAIVACSSQNPAPAETTTAAETAAATAAPAPSAAAPVNESTATDTSGGTQSNLERALPLPTAGNLPDGRWVAGTNYRVLSPAQPTNAAPGKVEVVEVFWYGCPHCYAFDPFLETWRKTAPSYVEFTRVPGTLGYSYRAHAKLFYTLVALGKIDELHTKVFQEIQKNGNPLIGNDDAESLKLQQTYFKKNGINETDYARAFESFTVRTKLAQAEDLGVRYRVDGVPAIIINGKYYSDVAMAGSHANLISLINDLTAAEKRR